MSVNTLDQRFRATGNVEKKEEKGGVAGKNVKSDFSEERETSKSWCCWSNTNQEEAIRDKRKRCFPSGMSARARTHARERSLQHPSGGSNRWRITVLSHTRAQGLRLFPHVSSRKRYALLRSIAVVSLWRVHVDIRRPNWPHSFWPLCVSKVTNKC